MPLPFLNDPSGPPGEEDAELLRRVRNGEEPALQQLHRRYAPLIFHLACRALDRAAAEEIVQDTFLAVWRRAGDFDPAKGSFRTWLVSIGRHRMLDELRARSRRPQADGELALDQAAFSAQDPLPDETLWREYQRDAVSEAMAALPEPQRAALRLAFFADLSHQEVAKALKVPLGTAKTRIRSGLRLLERHLGGLVALLLVALAGAGSWIWRRAGEAAQTRQALHLLSDSQTKALRLVPDPAPASPETGLHATFRSAPGAGLAVLMQTRFPQPAPGSHHVLWIRTGQGWQHVDLRPPEDSGKGWSILEAPWMDQGWPLELRVTVEAASAIPSAAQPSGPTLAVWREAESSPAAP
ncbi:MAG: sigma-70 family RNA polymerase sigma factor [Acidobacteria bacterium]|nr:sigma-70 family RNA polymerase sigma factor [Acidobacteriota bacterium]MBI3489013.1 sigma-70 family RNA polymerase sigma factor [Acidobacteriota bacterium]